MKVRGHLALAATVILTFSTYAHADRKVAQETAQVKEKLDQERQALLNSEIQKRGILGTLYDINKELSRVKSDLDSIEHQLADCHKTIESYARVIANLEKIRDNQKEILKSRLRALYKLGLKGYAEVLLSSQSRNEFSRNMKFLKIIAQKDSDLIQNYKVNVDALSAEQAKLRRKVKTYLEFAHELKTQNARYSEQKATQMAFLAKIDRDRNSHLQAIKEWREAGKKLEEKLVQLGMENKIPSDIAKGAFYEQRGLLRPPVPDPIVQKYGIIKNEKFHTEIFHKGLFFAAHPGETVAAVYDGRVAFAGWINGYGETIIIDHGDHYYSLYAHNSQLEKKSGDQVSSGDAVALAGDTGSLRGPGLYMEIRHFSESLDPLPWLDLPKATRL